MLKLLKRVLERELLKRERELLKRVLERERALAMYPCSRQKR